jgi:hypothetical protein
MGVCLCFCPVPALGESGVPAWPVYPPLWIWRAADPDNDLFCTVSRGCGLFRWNDRSDNLGIWDWHAAGSVVPHQALGLFSCCLEFPWVCFGSLIHFLGSSGRGTGYMDPSAFFFRHTYMACMGVCVRVPAALDFGRSGLHFKRYCGGEPTINYLCAGFWHRIISQITQPDCSEKIDAGVALKSSGKPIKSGVFCNFFVVVFWDGPVTMDSGESFGLSDRR